MSDFAQEGGHWYLPDGEPFYTIVGKNGIERPVTLRDARPVGAVPSVTGIIRLMAAPQLEKWKRTQLALACLTLPRIEGESSDSFLGRAEKDWQKEGRDAAERGTEIHGAVERFFRNRRDPSPALEPWVRAIQAELPQYGYFPERSFAHPDGFGGKVDLHSPEWVIDLKGKEWNGDDVPSLYDEHPMQLGAYRHGLGLPRARCGILFFNRLRPLAHLVEIKESELQRGLTMFQALLALWKAKNRMAA